MDNLQDLPTEVVDAIHRFVEHLHGRGPALDLDGLSDEDRSTVEELLPVIASEVIGSGTASDSDVPDWDDDPIVEALGLRPVPGQVRLRGDAVRRARAAAGLSVAELARQVSANGVTIDSNFLDDIERRLGTAVDPKVADAMVAALGTERDEVTFTDDDLGTAVQDLIGEIVFARPDVAVRVQDMVVRGGRRPLAALHVAQLGLVARIALFDVNEANLWSPDVLAAAEAAVAADPDMTAVLLVAAVAEWPTQIVDVADLANAYIAPSGQRLQVPRRPILPIGDAVRLLFEGALPVWDDVDLDTNGASDLMVNVIALGAARESLTKSTAGRPRIEPKIRGLELVRSRLEETATGMAELIEMVRDQDIDDASFTVRLLELVPAAS